MFMSILIWFPFLNHLLPWVDDTHILQRTEAFGITLFQGKDVHGLLCPNAHRSDQHTLYSTESGKSLQWIDLPSHRKYRIVREML
jgi:hypothetical protein